MQIRRRLAGAPLARILMAVYFAYGITKLNTDAAGTEIG
jgi:hypothetical protein